MEQKLAELRSRLAEVFDLNSAVALLSWDQETYMPPGGAEARAQQMATLGRIAHEKYISDEIGQLLQDLRTYETSLPYESDDASLLRFVRRDYTRRRRVPAEFVERFTEATARSYSIWARARPENDFAAVQPWLEKILDLSREQAAFFPEYAEPMDALIEDFEPGMTSAEIRRIFGELRAALVPLVAAITSQPPADDRCLWQNYPEAAQWAFGEHIVRQMGYDFQRGRQDKTAHPFCTRFDVNDVRITTRVRENFLGEALFSTMHESGHAMYEQGIDPALARTPLANGASSGLHESQSRLWENLVGRSRGFWQHYYPELQKRFPAQLASVSLDTFYRAINKVERSLIRTDADEVTYNLHVMLRFDFETAMLENKLSIRDLPEAWNARMQEDLGLVPPSLSVGAMQDVHWYGIGIGGLFQGYTLGNILSAQFMEAAMRAHPTLPAEIAAGRFEPLHGWLQQNIYRHGSKFTPPELVQQVTGKGITIEPYITYLKTKYGELYSI